VTYFWQKRFFDNPVNKYIKTGGNMMLRTLRCNRMKVALPVVMALMILVLLVGCSAAVAPSVTSSATPTTTAAPKEPIRIGITEDQSGMNAVAGRSAIMGATLAADEWNKKGGIYGGHPIELVVRDNGGDPTKATTIAKELIDLKVAGVVGGTSTTVAVPEAKVLSAAKISLITSSSSSDVRVPGPDGKVYGFNMYVTDYVMPDIIMTFCQSKGWHKLAIVYNNVAFCQNINKAVHENAVAQNYAQKYGVEIVGDAVCDIQSKDYSAEVSKILGYKPDVILGALYPNTQGIWLNSYKNLGGTIPMVTMWGFVETAWKTLDKSLTSNIIYAWAYESEKKPSYAAEYEKLVKMFNREPEGVLWDRGYEGVNWICKAVDAVGPDSAAVRDYMASKLTGQPTILGKNDATIQMKEGMMWNNLPYYTALSPNDCPWVQINSKGEKVFIQP
jgi:branched-chain amino acid transport system substrate-binding protein